MCVCVCVCVCVCIYIYIYIYGGMSVEKLLGTLYDCGYVKKHLKENSVRFTAYFTVSLTAFIVGVKMISDF